MPNDGHGISEKYLGMIKTILAENTPDIEKACLYGSRATGQYKPYSDIDLVLYGNISDTIVARLWARFFDSTLPYKVDVTAYNCITYPPLKQHIDEVSRPLFTKQQLYTHTNR